MITEITTQQAFSLMGTGLQTSSHVFGEGTPLKHIENTLRFNQDYKPYGYIFAYLCRPLKTIYITKKQIAYDIRSNND